MIQKIYVFILICFVFVQTSCGQDKDELVTISTNYGDIKMILFDKTPKHKNNFLKLAKDGFYDSLIFHRVIQGFMIQGGDNRLRLGKEIKFNSIQDYLIDAEFDSSLFHKKGALAAARTNNPAMASSYSQFYLVEGKKYSDEELDVLEMQMNRKIPQNQRLFYKTVGDIPHLDMGYTVFGEVIAGLDVVEKIAATPTEPGDRPVDPIVMKVKIETLKKKVITKKFGYKYE